MLPRDTVGPLSITKSPSTIAASAVGFGFGLYLKCANIVLMPLNTISFESVVPSSRIFATLIAPDSASYSVIRYNASSLLIVTSIPTTSLPAVAACFTISINFIIKSSLLGKIFYDCNNACFIFYTDRPPRCSRLIRSLVTRCPFIVVFFSCAP